MTLDLNTSPVALQGRPDSGPLQRFRVTYSDTRTYYYDVEAVNADAAAEIAERRCQDGDDGTDHPQGGLYQVHETTEELES